LRLFVAEYFNRGDSQRRTRFIWLLTTRQTSATINDNGMTDLIIREPAPNEIPRAAYLFRNSFLRQESRVLVAVRSLPVERFVAGIAWWIEGAFGRFQLATQSGAPNPEAFERLINQVAAFAQKAGLERLQYADLLTDDDQRSNFLRNLGFEPLATDRFFEIACQDVWVRLMPLCDKYEAHFPSDWRTESIRSHPPELVLNLIRDYKLMSADELLRYWNVGPPWGFEPVVSGILFDGVRPIGALLTRAVEDMFFVDVRVVHMENRRLRALGNMLLLRHVALHWKPGGLIQRLQFRGGEIEHRETANLAIRMGGHELPPRYIFAKKL